MMKNACFFIILSLNFFVTYLGLLWHKSHTPHGWNEHISAAVCCNKTNPPTKDETDIKPAAKQQSYESSNKA